MAILSEELSNLNFQLPWQKVYMVDDYWTSVSKTVSVKIPAMIFALFVFGVLRPIDTFYIISSTVC